MRAIDSNTLNALTGSRAGDKLTVYAWYDGRLSYDEPLPVNGYRLSWDSDRQVQTMSLNVVDKDGKLAPWLLEDPLGVGGARLQVRYDVGNAGPVNIGWYRVVTADPVERWHAYVIDNAGQVNPDSPIPADKKLVMVSGGATINITAYDLAIVAKNARLLAPESPKGDTPTVVGEIKRLLADIMPVVTLAGVVDRGINKSTVYPLERLDAVQDLCSRISCAYRMNGDGQLEIYPIAKQTPVATLKGGPDGLLVQVDRSQNIEGLYNQFIATGTKTVTNSDGTTAQVPVRAITQIAAGPLSIYGPHGRVPKFYESPMLTSQEDCESYANEMMQTQISGLTVDLKVTALPLPHLQQGDWVQVGNPVVNGQEVTLVGSVKIAELSSPRSAPEAMRVTVRCSYADVQTVMGGVDRE